MRRSLWALKDRSWSWTKGRRNSYLTMTIGNRSSEMTLIGQRVPLGKGITGLAAQMREVQIGAPAFKTRQVIYSCVIACIVLNVPRAGANA